MSTARWTEQLLDLLYPPRCAACSRPGAWLCDNCRASVHPPSPPCCPRCGQSTGGDQCHACAVATPVPEAVRAVGQFEGPLRQAILRLKYGNLTAVAPALARLLQGVYAASGWHCDLIVPVPLHPARERERGYNQAVVLAKPLARATGLAFEPGALRRTRRTGDQIGLDVAGRRANVAGAFRAERAASIAGRSVLLIDDVATTGCTLDSCAAALLHGGARRVYGLVLARRTLQDERDGPDGRGSP